MEDLCVLLQRHCPLPPRLSRLQPVDERESVLFQSNIDRILEVMQGFEPLAGTLTPVLLDRWDRVRAIGKAAHGRSHEQPQPDGTGERVCGLPATGSARPVFPTQLKRYLPIQKRKRG